MLDKLAELKQSFDAELAEAKSRQQLSLLRDRYLGRKGGRLTLLMKGLKSIAAADRKEVGRNLNQLKAGIEAGLGAARERIESESVEDELATDSVDVTLPGKRNALGHLHPLTRVRRDIEEIFHSIGYSVEDGPELETTYYNFEALNIPEDHPARDQGDTFYVSESLLLRTHTSPVQIRTMERRRPPLRIICPGTVYRRDNPDATHSPVFQQVEGLAVDERLTFRDFKGTMEYFLKAFFSEETKVRFRPSYFGFTEPSAELDISCTFCSGGGCRVCKQSGWIEVLGAGMVDPEVFGQVGIDPERYTGFAFGIGIERFAMMKYGVDNIQHFYQNDLRFLAQF
jgi:phenylalanyl-tRNA synthetase alpha chain